MAQDTEDKQLQGIELEPVLEKQRLGQAMNAKEFAVCAGVSYSTARSWFRLPGFPVFHGVIFWQISSNGVRIKMELAASLKNFRKTTVSKFLPTFLHGLHKYCSTLVNSVQSKTIFRGVIYL